MAIDLNNLNNNLNPILLDINALNKEIQNNEGKLRKLSAGAPLIDNFYKLKNKLDSLQLEAEKSFAMQEYIKIQQELRSGYNKAISTPVYNLDNTLVTIQTLQDRYFKELSGAISNMLKNESVQKSATLKKELEEIQTQIFAGSATQLNSYLQKNIKNLGKREPYIKKVYFESTGDHKTFPSFVERLKVYVRAFESLKVPKAKLVNTITLKAYTLKTVTDLVNSLDMQKVKTTGVANIVKQVLDTILNGKLSNLFALDIRNFETQANNTLSTVVKTPKIISDDEKTIHDITIILGGVIRAAKFYRDLFSTNPRLFELHTKHPHDKKLDFGGSAGPAAPPPAAAGNGGEEPPPPPPPPGN